MNGFLFVAIATTSTVDGLVDGIFHIIVPLCRGIYVDIFRYSGIVVFSAGSAKEERKRIYICWKYHIMLFGLFTQNYTCLIYIIQHITIDVYGQIFVHIRHTHTPLANLSSMNT